MILSERIFNEINSIVVSTLSLPSQAIVTKATKFVRFDWKSLIQLFESVGGGLEPPYCIIRPGPSQESDWGMHNMAFTIPLEIFLVESERNKINTTVITGAASATQEVTSTAKMFVDQRLYFETAGVYRIVASITDATHVVLTSSVTTVNGEGVTSDITSDVEVKIEKLRTAFKPGGSFTTFQLVTDPSTDVSDMNPANDHYGHDNYSLLAGSCYLEPLLGETL